MSNPSPNHLITSPSQYGDSPITNERTDRPIMGIFARLRNSLRRLGRFCSKWWHIPKSDTEVLYPQHDETTVAESLGVHRRAEIDGRDEMPHKDSSRQMAAVEQLIDSKIVGLLMDARTRATRRIIAQDSAFKKISVEMLTARIEGIESRVKSEFDRVFANGQSDMTSLAARREAADRELNDFRNTHKRHYPARIPDSQILGVAILFLVWLIETGLNAVFFAEGSDLGLTGGIIQAAVLAAVNIVCAALVSHHAVRWIHHRHLGIKLIGGVLTAIYSISILLFLLFITRYRHAFTTDPDTAFALAIEAIQDGTLLPQSETSLAFFLLSVLFAVVALIDVYQLDDPYPGYGRVQRAFDIAQEEEQQRHDKLARELESLREELKREQASLHRELDIRLGWLGTISCNSVEAITGWQPYVKRVRQLHSALLANYRQANCAARHTMPPPWFKYDPDLDSRSYSPPDCVVRNTDLVRQRIGALHSKSNEIVVLLNEQYTRARTQLQAIATSRGYES